MALALTAVSLLVVRATPYAGAQCHSERPGLDRYNGLPRLVGHMGGSINALRVRDHLAYLGHGPRISVIDIRDPARMLRVGQAEPMRDLVMDLELVGRRAIAAGGRDGLRVFDVADPRDPRALGGTALPGTALDVALAGSHAYVATGAAGLSVVDVSRPGFPVLVAQLSTREPDASITRVAVAGAMLVASVSSGYLGGDCHLLLYEITDPVRPRAWGRLDDVGHSYGPVVASGRIIYTAHYDSVVALEATSATSVREVGRLRLSTPNAWVERVEDLSVGSRHADGLLAVRYRGHMGHSAGGAIIDVSDPAQMRVIGGSTYRLPSDTGDRLDARGVALSDRLVIDHAASGRLFAADFSSTPEATITGQLPLVGRVQDLATRSGRLFVLPSEELHVYDLASPADPALIGATLVGQRTAWLDVGRDFVYLAGLSGGCIEATELVAYDVTEPDLPRAVPLSTADLDRLRGWELTDVAPDPPYAHAAWARRASGRYDSILTSFHEADTEELTIEGEHAVPGLLTLLEARSGLVFAADFAKEPSNASYFVGLHIFGWTERTYSELATIAFEKQPIDSNDLSYPAALTLSESRAYLATNRSSSEERPPSSRGTLYIVDTAEPSMPVVLSSVELPGTPRALLAAAGRLYVGLGDWYRQRDWGERGLAVIDVSEPRAARHLATMRTPSAVVGLALSSDHVYAATDAGIYIYELDPAHGWHSCYLPSLCR